MIGGKRQQLGVCTMALAGAPLLCLLLANALGVASCEADPQNASGKTEKSGTNEVKFKGILEPVNYGKDINLTDAFFTGPDEGWIVGEHATILKTANAGKSWEEQVGGDPNNQEKTMRLVRFQNRENGWVLQDGAPAKFLHTNDGQNWEEIGEAPRGVQDFAFTSTKHGMALTNGSPGYSRGAIFLTEDSGKTWKPVMECMMSTTVSGLARNDGCWFVRLEKLSERSAYALACDNNDSAAIFRTEDAGQNWNYVVLPMNRPGCKEADFFLTDADHGVLVFRDGKTYVTTDGAKNWRLLLATTVGARLRFTDREVGWGLWSSPSNWRAMRISYTTDGGEHWKASGDIDLPLHNGDQYKFAFPRRDRAYIFSDHGMVYRYSIVPASYTAANSFNAPLMPRLE